MFGLIASKPRDAKARDINSPPGQQSQAKWLPWVCSLAFGVGTWFRWRYALVDHQPRHSVISDTANMMATAAHFVDKGQPQVLADTIWPPATPAFISALRSLDATLGLAAFIQLLLSCSVPLLIAHTALLIVGPRAAWLSLAFASLHFGYIHYTGFFLSESLFQFFCTLAIWLTVIALIKAERGTTPLRAMLWGGPVGASWACAALFRPNALPISAFMGIAIIAYGRWRHLERTPVWLLMGAALAGGLLLAPAAHRCSTIKGSACLVSTNEAMNIALGQAGAVSTLRFENPETGDWSSWSPPSLWQHRYWGSRTVPAEIYDTPGVLRWVAEQWRRDPSEALTRAIGNALDLFRIEYWPARFRNWTQRDATVNAQLFTLLVLIPGLLGAIHALRAARRQSLPLPVVAMLSVIASVVLLAALSQGEPRYRVPFDPMWIVFGAAIWARAPLTVAPQEPMREGRARLALITGGVFATASALFILAMSHPALALGTHFSEDPFIAPRRARTIPASVVSAVKRQGHPWNKDTQLITCGSAHCDELRVRWTTSQHATRVHVSLDHNDRYRLTFYQGGRPIGFLEVPLARFGEGLNVHTLVVPKNVEGFDEVGIIPLYGDGVYALGHLLPRN